MRCSEAEKLVDTYCPLGKHIRWDSTFPEYWRTTVGIITVHYNEPLEAAADLSKVNRGECPAGWKPWSPTDEWELVKLEKGL